MNYQHAELAEGKWQKLTLAEQLGNIGSEVSRAEKQRGKNLHLFNEAVERALELFDLTIRDSRWRSRLTELTRAREVLCDTVFGKAEYQTSLAELDRYFFHFAYLARVGK